MKPDQTVSEYLFTLGSESLLEELAEESEYWSRAHNFVEGNYDKQVADLSDGQKRWLMKIHAELLEEAAK